MRILFLLMFIFGSCSQVKTLKPIDESKISPLAKIKLDEARNLIKENKSKLALSKLAELHDENLSEVEKALKYNLKGVMLFNLSEYDKSILNFEVSEKYAPKDSQLFNQIQLNIASGHYKLEQFPELKIRLDKIDRSQLDPAEIKKYAYLKLAYANKVEDNLLISISSLLLMGDLKTTSEVQSSNFYEDLNVSFGKLAQEQKIKVFEEFNSSENIAVAYLAQLEAEERYTAGDRNGAQKIVSWLKSEFGSNDEIQTFIKGFDLRIENSTRISFGNIGLVLPLTGERSKFGQKALAGVEGGLKVLGLTENIKIHIKDNLDSSNEGAKAVLDLIKDEKVSFIIGGLFPESAVAEYLEAKKYGVLYLSLSQINLPKEEKNQHLIEIQGSVESQVESLLSEKMINKFGARLGVIFPDNEAGRAYIDEIWRKASQKKVEITSVSSFQKNTHDYRDTAQLFLGLKYPRERSEELKILDDVYSLEKSSIRRVQTLPPVLDFDWVFLATFPHEATQLISTLNYYDANRIKIVGGPSWVSKTMVKEQKNLGTLYFVGEDPKDINEDLLTKFQSLSNRPAGLIEILSLDAIKVGTSALLAAGEVSNRDDFDIKLRSMTTLMGLTTSWSFSDGIWLKKMEPLSITKGEIVKLFGPESL